MGRLKTMSNTIQKLARYDAMSAPKPSQAASATSKSSRSSTASLNGLVIVVGDFNSDQNSVTGKLLTTGYSPYGNLKDRNYKANVSKASAFQMRHDYQFQDVYKEDRNTHLYSVRGL